MAIRQLRGGQGKAYALPNSNMPFPATSIGGRTHNSITLVAQTTRRCEVAWRTVAACALEKHGPYSAEVLAEQKRARELLIQSRELLKQMQAG